MRITLGLNHDVEVIQQRSELDPEGPGRTDERIFRAPKPVFVRVDFYAGAFHRVAGIGIKDLSDEYRTAEHLHPHHVTRVARSAESAESFGIDLELEDPMFGADREPAFPLLVRHELCGCRVLERADSSARDRSHIAADDVQEYAGSFGELDRRGWGSLGSLRACLHFLGGLRGSARAIRWEPFLNRHRCNGARRSDRHPAVACDQEHRESEYQQQAGGEGEPSVHRENQCSSGRVRDRRPRGKAGTLAGSGGL